MPKSFIIIDEGEDVKEMVKDGIRKRILLFPPYIRLSMVEVMRELYIILL
jgi:hypothetical protein